MTEEEKDRIEKAARDKAFQEAGIEGRLKAVEDAVAVIRRAAENTAKWVGRAVLGGIVWLATEIADKIPQNWWPK
jgi:hypothetical protein